MIIEECIDHGSFDDFDLEELTVLIGAFQSIYDKNKGCYHHSIILSLDGTLHYEILGSREQTEEDLKKKRAVRRVGLKMRKTAITKELERIDEELNEGSLSNN